MKFLANFACLIAALWQMIMLAFMPRPSVAILISIATAICCIARYWRDEDGTDDRPCGTCVRTIEKGGALKPFIAGGLLAQASMLFASHFGLPAEAGLAAFTAAAAAVVRRSRNAAMNDAACPECDGPLAPDPLRAFFSRPT